PTPHLRCDAVTSPLPVGSTATPGPPRPLSRYTTPPPSTGDTVSPLPAHHHSSLPSAGSTPCTASDAAARSCTRSPTRATTGVLWLKLFCGRFCSHFTSPVVRSKATSRDDFLMPSHCRMIVSPKSTGLAPKATSKSKGTSSLRQTGLPSRVRAAITD